MRMHGDNAGKLLSSRTQSAQGQTMPLAANFLHQGVRVLEKVITLRQSRPLWVFSNLL